MACAFVRATKVEAGTGTSVTATITSPAAGNLMVGIYNCFNGTASNMTCSDNVNSTYTVVDRTVTNGAGANHHNLGSFYFKNTGTTGAMTGTFNGGASTNGITGYFSEVSGASTTAPFTTGENSTNAASTTACPTTAKTPATADSIIFVAVTDEQASSTCTDTFTTPQSGLSWSQAGAQVDNNSFNFIDIRYAVQASSASVNPSWTVAAVPWCNLLVAFNAGGGAVAAPPAVLMRSLRGVGF